MQSRKSKKRIERGTEGESRRKVDDWVKTEWDPPTGERGIPSS
jgi:hypothetical protein